MLERIATKLFHLKPQENSWFAKQWQMANIEGRSSLLSLPPAVEFETTRSEIEELQSALHETDKRLTTLEGKILGTICPTGIPVSTACESPNAELTGRASEACEGPR